MLLNVVPEQHKAAGLPCHFIPLNSQGDTVKSLEQTGNRERLEETVKNWLQATIERLKRGEDVLGVSEVKY